MKIKSVGSEGSAQGGNGSLIHSIDKHYAIKTGTRRARITAPGNPGVSLKAEALARPRAERAVIEALARGSSL